MPSFPFPTGPDEEKLRRFYLLGGVFCYGCFGVFYLGKATIHLWLISSYLAHENVIQVFRFETVVSLSRLLYMKKFQTC